MNLTTQEALAIALAAVEREHAITYDTVVAALREAFNALEPWKPTHNADLDRWHCRHIDGRYWLRTKARGDGVPVRYRSEASARKWCDQLNKAAMK